MSREKARAAGRKAYAKSRKRGFSVTKSLQAYAKAYSAVWSKSLTHKKYMERYRHNWSESEQAMLVHRDSSSRLYLKQAIKYGRLMPGGWPDAGRIEQKTGTGFVSCNQWLRAAWAETRDISFTLYFAPNQEAALHPEKCQSMSFASYAQKLGMLKGWNELVRKLKKSAEAQK